MWDRKLLVLVSCSVFWTLPIVGAKRHSQEKPPVEDESRADERNVSLSFNVIPMEATSSTVPSTSTVTSLPRGPVVLPYKVCVPTQVAHPQYRRNHNLQLLQDIKSSTPKLDGRTLANQVALTLFFESHLQNIESLVDYVKTSSENFLRELKAIRSTVTKLTSQRHNEGDFPDLLAQMARMSSGWEDNLSTFNRWKSEWDTYMRMTLNNSPKPMSDFDAQLMAAGINKVATQKKQELEETLGKLVAALDKVVYLDGKTTDPSSFAFGVASYLREMLDDDNLHSNQEVATATSSKSTGVSRSQAVNLKNQLHVPEDPPCSQLQNGNLNYESEISDVYSAFNALPVEDTVKQRLFRAHIFFHFGLESMTRFGSNFNNTVTHFLEELRSTDSLVGEYTPDDPDSTDAQALVDRLAVAWADITYYNPKSSLVLVKSKWDKFLASSTPMTEQQIKERTDNFTQKVDSLLSGVQAGTTQVSHIGKKVVESSGRILRAIRD